MYVFFWLPGLFVSFYFSFVFFSLCFRFLFFLSIFSNEGQAHWTRWWRGGNLSRTVCPNWGSCFVGDWRWADFRLKDRPHSIWLCRNFDQPGPDCKPRVSHARYSWQAVQRACHVESMRAQAYKYGLVARTVFFLKEMDQEASSIDAVFEDGRG